MTNTMKLLRHHRQHNIPLEQRHFPQTPDLHTHLFIFSPYFCPISCVFLMDVLQPLLLV